MTEVSVETCFGNLKSVVVFLKIQTKMNFKKNALLYQWQLGLFQASFSHFQMLKFAVS